MSLAASFPEPRGSATSRVASASSIVTLQANGARTPVFAVGAPAHLPGYKRLVQHLGEDQPFFALVPGETVKRVGHRAAGLAREIAAFRPDDAGIVVGYAECGPLAFELGRQLHEGGRMIIFIALFAAPFPSRWKLLNRYTPRRFTGPVCLFLPSESWACGSRALRWSSVARQAEEYYAPYGCDAPHLFSDPFVRHVARLFASCRDLHSPPKPASGPASALREDLRVFSADR